MTDEEKAKAAMAEKDRRFAELEGQLAAASKGGDEEVEPGDVRARAVAAQEVADASIPSPTQEELDRVKLGEARETAYKTRQARAK